MAVDITLDLVCLVGLVAAAVRADLLVDLTPVDQEHLGKVMLAALATIHLQMVVAVVVVLVLLALLVVAIHYKVAQLFILELAALDQTHIRLGLLQHLQEQVDITLVVVAVDFKHQQVMVDLVVQVEAVQVVMHQTTLEMHQVFLGQQTLVVVVAVDLKAAAEQADLELSSFGMSVHQKHQVEQSRNQAAIPITHSHHLEPLRHNRRNTWDILQK